MVRRVKTKKEQAAPLRFMSYESCNSLTFQGKENGTETVTFVEKFLMTF